MFLSNIWCRKRLVFAFVKKIQAKKAIIDIIGLPSLKNVAGVSSGASCFLYLLLCLIIFEMYSQSFMSIWRSQIVCYYLATLYTSHYVLAGYCQRHNGLRYFFNSIKTFDSFYQFLTTLTALTDIKSFDSFYNSGRRGFQSHIIQVSGKGLLSVRVIVRGI